MRKGVAAWVFLAAAGAAPAAGGGARTVAIEPVKDNTLFSTGTTSNGAGNAIFSGQTDGGTLQRAVLAFDVAAHVPAGATVTAASLRLRLLQTSSGPQLHSLHRLLADWGEGASVGSGGTGAPAAPGDATWFHTFFPDQFWQSPGGDFEAAASSGQTVGSALDFYTWPSTPQMVADVQSWLDDPQAGFGWLLAGNEAVLQTAKKFASRESPEVAWRPVLTIEFLEPCPFDLTGDGDVGVDDLLALLGAFGSCGGGGACPADFDGDGTVGVSDLLALLGALGPCPGARCPWDVDGDGVVGVADLLAVLSHPGPCADPGDCPYDVNGDGVVDSLDAMDVALHLGPCG